MWRDFLAGKLLIRAGRPITEPHADGEIMTQTLLDLRRALVRRFGADEGAKIMETLITEAIFMLPDSATFLDLRNQLLLANPDQTIEGVIWNIFARRGMGLNARAGTPITSTGRSNVAAPIEDFTPAP